MASDVRITDGQFDFSGGIDSSKVPTIVSPRNSRGLRRDQLAWLTNGTVRDGGITTRTGFQPVAVVRKSNALYQGGLMYDTEPLGGNAPFLMLSIGGRMYQIRLDTDNSVHDITTPATQDPPNAPQAYFCQAEQWMVKQAGDGITLPLFYSNLGGGTGIIRRSNGLTGSLVFPNISELPAATSMIYYMGRVWYAQNRKFCAGDIVGNPSSGAPVFGFTDSVVRVTESPLAFGGDGFALPAMAGNIRALNYPIALDTTLGQGPLFIFTPKQIYALTVPVDRASWIAASQLNTATTGPLPLLRLIMNSNGAVSDRSIVSVNGDLFYQSLDPAVRSFIMAVRYYGTWGSKPISRNINRILNFNNRLLMRFASGTEFNSRLLQAIHPVQTTVGVAHQDVAILDTDPVSTLQDDYPAVWEGVYEGLLVLQLFSGNFGGLERAFAAVLNQVSGNIEVWELTQSTQADNGDNRITMWMEFPAHNWPEYPPELGGGPFEFKELDGFTLWVDRVHGTVDFTLQYRPDSDCCWYPWGVTQICSSRNCQENLVNPCTYPILPNCDLYAIPMNFPKPNGQTCGTGQAAPPKRPTNFGYQFQTKLTVKGWCRIRGYQIHALGRDTPAWFGKTC